MAFTFDTSTYFSSVGPDDASGYITCGADSKILVLTIGVDNQNNSMGTGNKYRIGHVPTYGGKPFNRVAVANSQVTDYVAGEMWCIINPSVGSSYQISVGNNSTDVFTVICRAFSFNSSSNFIANQTSEVRIGGSESYSFDRVELFAPHSLIVQFGGGGQVGFPPIPLTYTGYPGPNPYEGSYQSHYAQYDMVNGTTVIDCSVGVRWDGTEWNPIQLTNAWYEYEPNQSAKHYFDASAFVYGPTTNPVTTTYTCGGGTSLLVIGTASNAPRTGGAPTFGGKPLVPVDSSALSTYGMWYMLNPSTGSSYTVSVPNAASVNVAVFISSYISETGYSKFVSSSTGVITTSHAAPVTKIDVSQGGGVLVNLGFSTVNNVAPSKYTENLLCNKLIELTDSAWMQYSLPDHKGRYFPGVDISTSTQVYASTAYFLPENASANVGQIKKVLGVIDTSIKKMSGAGGSNYLGTALDTSLYASGSSSPMTMDYTCSTGTSLFTLGIVNPRAAHFLDTSLGTSYYTGNPRTQAYTCGTGTTVLVLGVFNLGNARGGADPTFGGIPMTLVKSKTNDPGESVGELWYLLNPSVGSSYTISCGNTANQTMRFVIASFKSSTGVSVLDSSGAAFTTSGSNPSMTLSPDKYGGLIVAFVNSGNSTVPSAYTHNPILPLAGGTTYTSYMHYGLFEDPGSYTLTATQGTDDYGILGVSFVTDISGGSRMGSEPTFGGIPMRSLNDNNYSTDYAYSELWQHPNPSVGSSYTISVPNSSQNTLHLRGVSFKYPTEFHDIESSTNTSSNPFTTTSYYGDSYISVQLGIDDLATLPSSYDDEPILPVDHGNFTSWMQQRILQNQTVDYSTGVTLAAAKWALATASWKADIVDIKKINGLSFVLSNDSSTTTLKDGLIACWELNELIGDRSAYDSYSTNHLSNTNSSVNNIGKIGKAYGFNGTSSRLSASTNLITSFPFTISYWMKLGVNSFNAPVSTHVQTNYAGVELRMDSTQLNIAYGDGGGAGVGNRFSRYVAYTIGTNIWHHVLFMSGGFDDSSLWIDGTKHNPYVWSTDGGAVDCSLGTGLLNVGKNWSDAGSTYAKGYFDQVAIWNRKLTMPEVSLLWNASFGYPYSLW